MISIQGDSSVIQLINKKIYNNYQNFLNNVQKEELQNYLKNDHPYSPYKYTFDAKVTCMENEVFSILYTSNWYMGGVVNNDYTGTTFSLKTGNAMSLKDVYFGKSEKDILSFIKKQVNELIDIRDDVFPEAKETVNGYELDDFNSSVLPLETISG